MKSQHIPSAQGQSDWDRNRNESDQQRTGGGFGSEAGRPYQRSAPEGYPESHYQYQAQRDHPGMEYFSGGPGYGGRMEGSQQQQGMGYGSSQSGYGGGSWSRSEQEMRNQGGYQAGGQHQQGFGSQNSGRGYGREDQGQFGQSQYGQGQYGQSQFDQGQYGQGQHRESQHSQFGRGSFEEEPFRRGGQQQGMGYGQYSGTQGSEYFQGGQQQGQGYYGGGQQHSQFQGRGEQFHGYGGSPSGQSFAGQSSQFGGHYGEHFPGGRSQGYSGGQTGQPGDYGNQQSGQFFSHGSHNTAQQPSGNFGSYGAYQVGTQPQGTLGRTPRGPKDYVRSDERLRELICENLAHHPAIDASEVSVQVSGGRVVLEGAVPERRMKHEIEDVADGCWGVKDVENRIRVKSGLMSGSDQSSQGWLGVPNSALTGSASSETSASKSGQEEKSPVQGQSMTGATATTASTSGAGSSSTTIGKPEGTEGQNKTK